jgi:hypothetical protein
MSLQFGMQFFSLWNTVLTSLVTTSPPSWIVYVELLLQITYGDQLQNALRYFAFLWIQSN